MENELIELLDDLNRIILKIAKIVGPQQERKNKTQLVKNEIKKHGGVISKSKLTIALRRKFKAGTLYGSDGVVTRMIRSGEVVEVKKTKASNGVVPTVFWLPDQPMTPPIPKDALKAPK